MASKLQVAIYKIDENSSLFSESDNFINSIKDHIESKGFAEQLLLGNQVNNYEMFLYYKNNPSNPKWKEFFQEVVQVNQPILSENQSFNESFVLLLSNLTSNNLYAMTGGAGYHVIQEYIDPDFGVDILSRLISKQDKILKSVKEKSVMGGILGTTKFFRNDYNLYENDSFGKIYQELKSAIGKDVLESKFGFSENDLKKDLTCIAKSSFKINKSITYPQLFQILRGCEEIFTDPDFVPVAINNVDKIIKKKNQSLISSLENELLTQLWNRYIMAEGSIDFDLCHKDYEKYLTATTYNVRKGSSRSNYIEELEDLHDIDMLFSKINDEIGIIESEDEFKSLLKALTIYSFDEDNQTNYLTKSSLIQHIFGDVTFESEKYFLIDNSWYRIQDSFISDLNISCKDFIENNFDSGIDKNWNYPSDSENMYNQSYISGNSIGDKIIVLDKVTPDNIEPCDILKWDDKNVYFYHVKAGFSNTMRDLCSQVFISANRIKQDINSGYSYIEKIYDYLLSNRSSEDTYFNAAANQISNCTKEEFVNIFRDRKPVFILAVLDSAANERNLRTDIEGFHSNIAKFSLQELIRGMKGIDIEFKITQISKLSSN